MFQNKFLLKCLFSLSLIAITPLLVLAQNNPLPSGVPPPPKVIPAENSQENLDIINRVINKASTTIEESPYPGTANCFDYYRFQSVQVSAATEKEVYNTGDEIVFRGKVTNENKYPVVDGYVFVRVGPTDSKYRTEGNNITDEFFAVERMALGVGAVVPIEFKWKVPKGAAPGEYIANYFFSVGKKFNLGGLPFSNEVIIGLTDFKIENNGEVGITFDRSGTTFNDKKYFHIGNWPVLNLNESVEIKQPLINLSKFKKDIKVTYELYFWDSLRTEDKVSEKSEAINLAPGATKILKYEIPKMDTSVYYLKIKAISDNDSAIVNLRFVSEQARPRINYPAITKFPILNGDTFSLFSCFHNTSGVNAEGNIDVILTDRNNNKVGEASYRGVIPTDMLAVASEIISKNTYDYLKLHAEIKNTAGSVIDSYDAVYDCTELKSPACVALPQQTNVQIIMMIIGSVLLILLIVVAVWIIRKRKNKPANHSI